MSRSRLNKYEINKLSIIVQGPYRKETKKLIVNLRNIFPKNQIILSCYDEKIDKEVEKIAKLIRNIDVGSINVPPRGAPLNLKRQATTTFSGCKEAKEDWVMKIRTDIEIIDALKLKNAIFKFFKNLKEGKKIKLLTLNTGSLDIFSYYQMPFHFNDYFFICKRSTLFDNCNYLRNFDEQILIDNFNPTKISNYHHRKKYSLLFHTEQLIHFCKPLLLQKKMNYCCEMKEKTILRNIIWNGKNLMIYTMQNIGIKSLKHGYPKLRSHLAGISFKSIFLYKLVYKSPRKIRFIFFYLLKLHGYIRKIIFLTLTYQKILTNRIKTIFLKHIKKYLNILYNK